MSNTTTTATTTRHAARCSRAGCSSFRAAGEVMCPSCKDTFNAGRIAANTDLLQKTSNALRETSDLTDRVKQVEAERDAAREAAVKDHAAHMEAMEAQERKADHALARMRAQRDEQCKMANDLRAEVIEKGRLLDQARAVIADRDTEIAGLLRKEANIDQLCGTLAERTQELGSALAQRDAAIKRGDECAKDADRLGRRNTRLGMVAFFAVLAAIGVMARYGALAALAAAMGWGR